VQTQIIATIHGLQAQSGRDESHLVSIIEAIVDNARLLAGVPIELHRSGEIAQLQLEEKSSVSVALVINELVQNAIKHGHFDDYPQIDVYLQGTPDTFSLRIINPGMFTSTALTQPGTGLGLVRLLLPPVGANLSIEPCTRGVMASLCLGAPVIALRTVLSAECLRTEALE
jgi:two-component sensor histidine kinase